MKESIAQVKVEMEEARADLDKELTEKREKFETEFALREAEIAKKELMWKEREEIIAKYSCKSQDIVKIYTDG
eukprot:CAMPEP_0170495010 /NCGR_PEP_ID=MMETSP0208-20121228/14967_1 /TAXON_ID=197538 /ORGANISM="Strombidium inclinatum, Strain S3" /LENGTH=72 /DNA_ID=CAMNT_0010771145 /DNA_START=237 /DNA_END=455 /DNA_ORIENTATION=-